MLALVAKKLNHWLLVRYMYEDVDDDDHHRHPYFLSMSDCEGVVVPERWK